MQQDLASLCSAAFDFQSPGELITAGVTAAALPGLQSRRKELILKFSAQNSVFD